MHGRGRQAIIADGYIYDGDFKNGKKDGNGKEIIRNDGGEFVYFGEYRHGERYLEHYSLTLPVLTFFNKKHAL